MNQYNQEKPEMEDLFAPQAADSAAASPDVPNEAEELPEFDPDVFERTSGTIVFPGANVPDHYDTAPPQQPNTMTFPENRVQSVSGTHTEDPAAQKARQWSAAGGVIGLVLGFILNAKLRVSSYKLPLCCALAGAKIGHSIYRFLIDTT